MGTSTAIRFIVYLGALIVFLPRVRSTNEDAETDVGDVIQYVDGDILIVVFAPITNQGDDLKCGRTLEYPGMAEQVNMFLEKVNSDPSILPGIKLGAIVINSCQSEIHSLRTLIEDIVHPYMDGYDCTRSFCQQGKRILAGVVGGASSAVSMTIAKILNIYEMPQVSYWSTSTALSDKFRFKYFFRNVPSDKIQARAMADFIEKRGWNYVSVVYTNNAYGVKGFQELSTSLKERGICIAESVSFPLVSDKADARRVLDVLVENKKAKVVILFATGTTASKLLSTAAERQEWRDIGWIASDGWAKNLLEYDDSYLDVIDGTVGFSLKFPSMECLDERMRSLTVKDYRGADAILNPWWQHYLKLVKNCTTKKGSDMRQCDEDESIPNFKANPNILDEAMEVCVHALEDFRRDTCPVNSRGVCDDMAKKAETGAIARELYPYYKNVSFITTERRRFKFDSFQDGPHLYDIVAFDKSRTKPGSIIDGWYTVGTYDEIQNVNISKELPYKVNTLKSVCSEECHLGYAKILSNEGCCWFCQKCADQERVLGNSCEKCEKYKMPNTNQTECIPIPIGEMQYTSGYGIACLSVGIFGLVCTMIMLGMYWKYRSSVIVRASARELCFFVVGGVIFTLLNCFTIAAAPSNLSCGFTRIILALGPAVMYSGLLMKTYRVFFVFNRDGTLPSRKKWYLKPRPLTVITTCVTLVQVLVVIVWMARYPPEVDEVYSTSNQEAFRSCKHIINEEVYIGLAYPFLVMVVCTVLATINRNVPLAFRETLFIGFTMYTTCVTWIAFTVVFFTNVDDHRIERQLTALSCSLSINAITVLLGLFVPKFYTILRSPELNTLDMVMSKRGLELRNRDVDVQEDAIETVAGGVVNKTLPNVSNEHDKSL